MQEYRLSLNRIFSYENRICRKLYSWIFYPVYIWFHVEIHLEIFAQLSLLMISKSKELDTLLLPLKFSENLLFSDNYMGDKSLLIHLNSLNVRSKI